jgi:hypothetical protein
MMAACSIRASAISCVSLAFGGLHHLGDSHCRHTPTAATSRAPRKAGRDLPLGVYGCRIDDRSGSMPSGDHFVALARNDASMRFSAMVDA